MGYGSRALELLQQYYEGKMPSLDEGSDSDDAEAQVSRGFLPDLSQTAEVFVCLGGRG